MMALALDSLGHKISARIALNVPVENGQVVMLGTFRVVPAARR
jgi:hypothetical protein